MVATSAALAGTVKHTNTQSGQTVWLSQKNYTGQMFDRRRTFYRFCHEGLADGSAKVANSEDVDKALQSIRHHAEASLALLLKHLSENIISAN